MKILGWYAKLSSKIRSISPGLPGGPPAADEDRDGGFLGRKLHDLRQTEFFTWFNLEPVEEVAQDRKITFRPSGIKFRPLVSLSIACDRSGRVTSAALALARGFIDDPTNGIFARDIAKSFLRAGLSKRDLAIAASIADQIEYLSSSSRPVLTTPRPQVSLPDHPTPAYLVFLGREVARTEQLHNSRLVLENSSGPPPELHLKVLPR
ncbi:MAG: hypothetical protein IVW56_07160 [Candidatus Binataceae bacterium]|nr:hypothetical protein [Candidatus Binataceae bacterium]